MSNLAIVIPAYKESFFEKTLSSFNSQTLKDFTIYVGDDCSPHDLKSICNKFKNDLDIVYTKFTYNIGSKNLVRQWTRCIELTKEEKWIWLFSDDDLIDTNCVENFYGKLNLLKQRKQVIDVFRFNTIVIDKNDKIIRTPSVGPEFETSEQMAYYLLLDKRSNSLADHIFSRKVYNNSGGLVFTEYAQGADWAMSILFSKKNGICVIQNSNFYWRYSGSNISSSTGSIKSQMVAGHLQFIRWLVAHFQYLKQNHSEITYNMIIKAAQENLKNVFIYHYKGFELKNIHSVISLMHNELSIPYIDVIKLIFTVFKSTNNGIYKLSKVKRLLLKKFNFS